MMNVSCNFTFCPFPSRMAALQLSGLSTGLINQYFHRICFSAGATPTGQTLIEENE